MNFFRFVVGEVGIYEAVDRDCPRNDPRRNNKPDGAWLPKVGEKFPGAISFWKKHGLDTYLHSGLQEWHRSVVNDPLFILSAAKINAPLYEDEFQVICRPEAQNLHKTTWEEYVAQNSEYPKAEKVVAYIVREGGNGRELLVFEHDKQWSEAGIQVPAGTVDPGEAIEIAAIREAGEESGLSELKIVRKIDEYVMYRNTHKQFNRRHVYLMEAPHAKDSWIHQVAGHGIDKGMNFHFYWLPLRKAEHSLAGSLGSSIRKILERDSCN